AATRAYVHRDVYDAFLARTAELFDAVRVGDPFDPATDLGTLISETQVARVAGFVERAVTAGARVVAGGFAPDVEGLPDGAFYRPTIVADCAQDSEIVQDEVFGPVLVVLPFGAVEDAFERANDTRFGLAASIWTRDVFVAMEAARTLEFGHVQVNDHLMITSEMPHGGFKLSGSGKDMSSYAFEEYTRVKHVMLELTGEPVKPWHHTIFGDKPAE
nr:aldehyde dehydrogenase family protein [Chloroflexota bacterium]